MHGNAKLECLAHTRGLYALPDAAPKRRVEQDNVTRRIQDICRKLFKIYNDGIGRGRIRTISWTRRIALEPNVGSSK